MNNQFLQHLKSITPQGRAEETKIFIPAEQIKAKEKEREAEVEELDEATRSKYLKLKYGTKGPYGNKVSDETIELARKKLDAAILRRGGATPEAIKRGVAKPFGIDQEVDMAKYRFGNKKAKHLQAAINAYNKKSPRKSVTEGVKRLRRLRSARLYGNTSPQVDAAYDKELSKMSASRLRRGGAPKQTIRGFFTDKPTTKAADKAFTKFYKGAMTKANAKGKKIFESEQLDELDKKTLASYIRKAAQNMENMGYASGWKNAKNQFGGNRLKELDWERKLAYTRQRKTKNRRRGIELATSQLSEEGLKAPSWLKKDPRKTNSAFRNTAKVHAAAQAAKRVGKKVIKALGTPQSSTDVEITGKNF
jgi:hypothetical protein